VLKKAEEKQEILEQYSEMLIKSKTIIE